jgi:hypothetical protein
MRGVDYMKLYKKAKRLDFRDDVIWCLKTFGAGYGDKKNPLGV